MPTIYDKHPTGLIENAAQELKKELEMPAWAHFVKTSTSKQQPPLQPDWYFIRAASILRKAYMLGPIGVNKLKVKYGSKKNRGHKPEEFRTAAGKIIRSILQQLEKKGYLKQGQKGTHKGRMITPKGRSFLDKLGEHGSQRIAKTETGRTPEPSVEATGTPNTT